MSGLLGSSCHQLTVSSCLEGEAGYFISLLHSAVNVLININEVLSFFCTYLVVIVETITGALIGTYEVKLNALLGDYDRPTTDQRTGTWWTILHGVMM